MSIRRRINSIRRENRLSRRWGEVEGCQAGYTRSTEETTDSQPQPQTHHIALCLVAYPIVERECFERGMTWRQFKRRLILKKPHTPLPALERLRMAA
jgi:hypothetical protein